MPRAPQYDISMSPQSQFILDAIEQAIESMEAVGRTLTKVEARVTNGTVEVDVEFICELVQHAKRRTCTLSSTKPQRDSGKGVDHLNVLQHIDLRHAACNYALGRRHARARAGKRREKGGEKAGACAR